MALPPIHDDKVQYLVPFIVSQLERHKTYHATPSSSPPIVIGINGVQGVGKSVTVFLLKAALEAKPYCHPTAVISLDDFYLTHAEQEVFARAHTDNPLLQHRELPGTHDIPLALTTLNSLLAQKPTRLPAYDKSAFAGKGDRVSESKWITVNTDPLRLIRVIILEGWSVGFQALCPQLLEAKHDAAFQALQSQGSVYNGRLAHNTLESVITINDALKRYDALVRQMDAFIHFKAADLQYVYKWRLQQEIGLRMSSEAGMTAEEVIKFVDGYLPAYELYSDALDDGVFETMGTMNPTGRQLTLTVDEDRKVQEQKIV